MEAKTQEELNAEAKVKAVQAAEDKAEKLTEKHGVKVTPFILGDAGEYVGFIKEPKLQAKKAAFDKIAQDRITDAGEIILSTSLIEEESAPEFKIGKNDDIYISACIACVSKVKVFANASKKK